MRLRGLKIALWGVIALAGLSAIVMLLWNLIIPDIIGLSMINFWQALGLFILARILFGGFHFGRRGMMMNHRMHHGRTRNPIHEKWNNMTPNQRKEFVEKRRKFGFGESFGRDRFDMEEHGKEHE